VLLTVYRIKKLEKRPRLNKRAVGSLIAIITVVCTDETSAALVKTQTRSMHEVLRVESRAAGRDSSYTWKQSDSDCTEPSIFTRTEAAQVVFMAANLYS
jgi:hypothetical protein